MRKELKARIKAPRGDLRNQNSGRPDAPLTGCASLHSLNLTFYVRIEDVSAFAGCASPNNKVFVSGLAATCPHLSPSSGKERHVRKA